MNNNKSYLIVLIPLILYVIYYYKTKYIIKSIENFEDNSELNNILETVKKIKSNKLITKYYN